MKTAFTYIYIKKLKFLYDNQGISILNVIHAWLTSTLIQSECIYNVEQQRKWLKRSVTAAAAITQGIHRSHQYYLLTGS